MRARARRWGVPLFVAALLLVAGYLIFRGVLSRRVLWERTGEAPPEQPAETRPVTLYYGTADGGGVAPERREAPVAGGLTETVRSVVLQLVAGPTLASLVPVLPAQTEVLDVYSGLDGVLYLNFGPGIVENHPGGSSAEYATLSSLVQTMTENFPEVKAVQVLIDGRPRETLAGHFGIRDPLRPEDFR